jgi:oligopeptide/dipeptide ABC transporter ATP-binding protein
MKINSYLLQVQELKTYFHTFEGIAKAVDDVSFHLSKRETLGLVGESGCGKSVTALSIMRLVPEPPGRIVHGRISFDRTNLLELPISDMRSIRGNRISMIFQEPMTSLNPVYTVGNQIVEAIRLHQKLPSRQARARAVDMLNQVGIPDPAQRYKEYPHQLSGGMRQRAMIAMALSCNPELLIADEPTTALDVTIEAQMLDLLKRLQAERGLTIILITHDLAVVAGTADVVAVMYASKLAELADVATLFERPLHPYTQGLFRSLPRLGQKKERLETIAGSVPNPLAFPAGCKFHPRCPIGTGLKRCQTVEPELRQVQPNHCVACWECPGYDQAPAGDPAAAPIPYRRKQDDER